jgi:hypothetical protein
LCFLVFIALPFLFPQEKASADSSFLISSIYPATGTDTGQFSESTFRRKIDLAGTWQVSVDGEPPQPVEVPSAYDGVGEILYERAFTLEAEHFGNTSFRFIAYGINYYSEININGSDIGSHNGGHTSFVLPVPKEILRVGQNIIRVRVNNFLRTHDTLPVKSQLWTPKNYGGIFRDIYLMVLPETAIHGKKIRTTFLDGYSVAEMDVDFLIRKPDITGTGLLPGTDLPDPPTYHIAVEIFDRIRGTMLAQSRRSQVSFDNSLTISETVRVLARNPRLWSPDQPDLYVVSMILYRNDVEYDRKDITYGFRDISIRDGNIYINDTVFRGRGILYNEYHPRRGSAISYEDMERDVALMKITNINLVRIAFSPPHPYLLQLFDRYGMLCMIELPAVNIPGAILRNERFIASAQVYLEQMIERDRHHTSVFAWGIGDNLEMPSAGAVTYVKKMREHAQQFDDRPLYAGSQFPANDVATDYLDLAVLNIPVGMVDRVLPSIEKWKMRYADKPFIIGKLGFYVEPGNTGGYSNPRSHEAQAHYLLQIMQSIRDYEVDGIIIKSFTDWRAERPSTVSYAEDLRLHTSGILDSERRQRKGFEVVRSLYRGERTPSLIAGELPGTTPFEYIIGGFIVLIGFAYMLNSSRRFRENVNRSLIRPYNFYSDVRDHRILSGLQTLYLGLLISLTMSMVFASLLQHYSNNQIMDYVFTHFLITDSAKILFVNLINQTWYMILFFAGLYFIMLLMVTAIVQIISLFINTKVFLSHSFIVTFWSALPLVAFIPLSMILYNVLETEFYVIPILSLIGILMLWVFFRLLKGIAVIYDMLPLRIYVLGILILISVNGIMLLISEYAQSTVSYISFFIHMFEGFRF